MKLPRWLEWIPLGRVEAIDPAKPPCPANALAEHFYLLDVRTYAEWSQSRIRGSINVPLHRFSLPSLDLDTINKPVICICLSAHRSTPAVRKLRRAGIEAYELKGGMLNWWRLDLPTEKS
ncbi:rhodanese-like domain-containing protein [Pontibacterium granulatum]|uniref:rhodanese-like domain-containing protein n=1 Tax=Pontibacterium granulatum TaxID=2036029 RepID=UPI00249C419D|nr:rhodanese-like domain-containing protein [Pontibacterium granulatum]MDI3322772.1 rhodanese-like domain-containing protein [Pontibacterium granulatum]